MTHLLLFGLSTFADDLSILPLRPRTLRPQVLPGDAIDDVQGPRAMIGELAARGLVRRYTVDGVDYLSIVDWETGQRVGRRLRRRYPALPGAGEADAGPAASTPAPDDRKPLQSPSGEQEHPDPRSASAADDPPPVSAAASDEAVDAVWGTAVEAAVRCAWGADVPADMARHAARWRAEGRDLARDVLLAIARAASVAVDLNRPFRLELVDHAMAGVTPPVSMAQAIENHSKLAA